MFKLSGAVEQWILGNSKLSTKKKKKNSHSITRIMTQLGNKFSVTPLNAATPIPQKPPNPLAGGGGIDCSSFSEERQKTVSKRTQPFVLCQEASFLL